MMKVVFFFCCLISSTYAVTIAEWLALPENFARFNTFNRLANANSEIASILSSTTGVEHTVFAVPDSNFPGSAAAAALLNDVELATRTIRLHMVRNVGSTLSTPADGASFQTLAGPLLIWGVVDGAVRTVTIRGVNQSEVENVATLERPAGNAPNVFQVPNIDNGILYIAGPLLTFRNAQTTTAAVAPDPLGRVCIDGECSQTEYGCIDNDQLILRSRRLQRDSIVSLSFVNVRPPADDDDDVDFNFFTTDDGDVDDDNVGSADDSDASSDDDDNTVDPEDNPTCDRIVQLEESLQCRLNVSRKLRGSQWLVRTRIDGVDYDSCNNLTIGYMDPWDRNRLFGGDYAGIVIGAILMSLILLAAIIPALMAPATPPPAFQPEEFPIAVETPNIVDVQPPIVPLVPPVVAPIEPLVAPIAPLVDPGFAAPMVVDPLAGGLAGAGGFGAPLSPLGGGFAPGLTGPALSPGGFAPIF